MFFNFSPFVKDRLQDKEKIEWFNSHILPYLKLVILTLGIILFLITVHFLIHNVIKGKLLRYDNKNEYNNSKKMKKNTLLK